MEPSATSPETAPKAAKMSTSSDAHDAATPPFSPSSATPVLQKEQEEFEGTVDVSNDLPTEKDLARVGDLLVLDAQGQSRPFKELYNAPHVAPRQLIIFIRHFFCGVRIPLTPNSNPANTSQNCQEYLRTLSSSITPNALLALPTPTFITVIGCGNPDLIPMYTATTKCPFPIYADPTRKLYDYLGMTRTFSLGSKPAYMHTSVLINSVQSIFQGIGAGKKALKGGDMKQVGGEFLFEDGECTWVHRMRTTRGHAEVGDVRSLLGLDGARPPPRRTWSHDVKAGKTQRRSLSWGRLRSMSKGGKDGKGSGKVTPEKVEEEGGVLVGRGTI
jgi:hypothetical protein